MADLPSFNDQTFREIDQAVSAYWQNRPRPWAEAVPSE